MPLSLHPDGSFSQLDFTMKAGRHYKIIATTRIGDWPHAKYIHTVKNDQGEYAEFEHSELIRMVEENP